MKTKIKKLIFLSLIFFGGILSTNAQENNGPSRLGEPSTPQEIQMRLHALELCYDYYATTGGNTVDIDNYILYLREKLIAETEYIPSPVEDYVLNHPQDQNSARYIKCQAVVAFPEAYTYSAEGLAAVEAELLEVASQIANQ
jgi:hypothetical protein